MRKGILIKYKFTPKAISPRLAWVFLTILWGWHLTVNICYPLKGHKYSSKPARLFKYVSTFSEYQALKGQLQIDYCCCF